MHYRGTPLCDWCEQEVCSDDALTYRDGMDLCEDCCAGRNRDWQRGFVMAMDDLSYGLSQLFAAKEAAE